MRIPWATIALSVTIVAVYFSLSRGTLYIPDEQLIGLSATMATSQIGMLTHIFMHVGILHLLGNLIPLIALGWVAESAIGTRDALAIFLVAGVVGGLAFTLINPTYYLVGASAGLSGLLAAAVLTRPGSSILALIAIPLVLMVLLPTASWAADAQKTALEQSSVQLSQQVQTLLAENRTAEAAQANASLQTVLEAKNITETGQAREAATPSDATVHVLGGLVGFSWLLAFRKDALREGLQRYRTLGQRIRTLSLRH